MKKEQDDMMMGVDVVWKWGNDGVARSKIDAKKGGLQRVRVEGDQRKRRRKI